MQATVRIGSDVTRKQLTELTKRFKASEERVVELAIAALWAEKTK